MYSTVGHGKFLGWVRGRQEVLIQQAAGPLALLGPETSPTELAAWLTSWLALPSHERFNVAIAALTAVLPLATTSTAPPGATTPARS